MKDSTLAIPPFTRQEAGEMINRTRGSKLLKGFRGKPAADFDAYAMRWLASHFWLLILLIILQRSTLIL
jgi:hypothetical protein